MQWTRLFVAPVLFALACSAVAQPTPALPSPETKARQAAIRKVVVANLHYNLHCGCKAYDPDSRQVVRRVVAPTEGDIPALVGLLSDKNVQVGIGAVDLLEAIGPVSIPVLKPVADRIFSATASTTAMETVVPTAAEDAIRNLQRTPTAKPNRRRCRLTPHCSGLIVSRLRSFLFAAELDIVRGRSTFPKVITVKEERIVVVVPQVDLEGGTRTVGDLFFTNRQVFLARPIGGADPKPALGVVRAAAESQRSMNASQHLKSRPLDAIVAAADPRTRFEYRELEAIIVKLGGLFSPPGVKFIPHHGKRLKLVGSRAAFERLAAAVPLLAGMGAPISLT
jgi:hypothetical protein